MKTTKRRILCIVCALCALAVLIPFAARAMVSDETYEKKEFELPDTSAMEVGSSRHTQYDAASPVDCPLSVEGFEKKLETKYLEVWFRAESHAFRIVDKRSGYIWGALAEDKPEGLNQMWSSFANGLCSFEYFDVNDTAQRVGPGTFGVTAKYQWSQDGVTCTLRMKKEKLSFSFRMIVSDDAIALSVDDESIEENGEAKLKSVYFLPFLGSVCEDATEGYVFIPDGPGALMRFQKSGSYNAGFNQKVYGPDMGIDSLEEANDLNASRTNDYLVDAPYVSVPVYGIVHGARQNAFFAVLEQGEEYASIQATPAGATTDFTWAAARFDYRQLYIHPTSKNGAGIQRPQDERNLVNPTVRFYFLTGEDADYSGMAVKYRTLLKEQGVLTTERIDTALPMRLHLLGADVKKQFLVQGKQTFTTFDEAQEILRDLRENEITNLSVSFEGWQKGGINGASYGQTAFDRSVGSQKEALALRETLLAQGGRAYLTVNPVTANDDQIWLASKAAKTLSRTYAKFVRPNTQVMFNERYILKPALAAQTVLDTSQALAPMPLALEQWGSRLYAEYTRGSEITRSEALTLITQTQQSLAQKPALTAPNEYLWAETAEYFDMPVVNGQYLYETDTVPFLQIVLKGSIDYYAPYANQGFYSVNSVLKMAEYGMYPSFLVAACDNSELMDTPLQDLFTVNYGDWRGEIADIYGRLSEALLAVEGQQIVRHRMVAEGVACVTYSNDMKIYVNYNSTDYTGEASVPAQSFALVGK